jgi:EAL domain-containing protein (putative c-di-GMP-specific phosphodiesterase class I)
VAALVEDRERFGRDVADAVAATIGSPFHLGELALSMHGFTGLAWQLHSGDGPRELLARATTAAGDARKLGHPLVEAPREEQQPLDRLILAGQLQAGIARGELVLEYQPKRALRPGLTDAVEALVRWHHPELGPLSPQAFVPLAEQTGLIGALTRWVVSAAIRQCSAWHAAGITTRVAVNVSARDVVDPELAGYIERELRESDLPPGLLQLEVTETELIGEPREAGMTLRRLARIGVLCAIDDFGTGYSSLAQLQSLPFDEIKIDRSFVARLERSAADAVIVQSTIGLARNLGLRVTAEGVETRETLERLLELGCDYAQGYHVGKPMPAHACQAVLAEISPGAARRFRQTTRVDGDEE